MRYRELFEQAAWRHYTGDERACRIVPRPNDATGSSAREGQVRYGSVKTGRQRVWVGYAVCVALSDGTEWLAEHPYSIRAALREVEAKLNLDGWGLDAIGLDPEWRESGLSANSGYGFHPAFNRGVHFLEQRPEPST